LYNRPKETFFMNQNEFIQLIAPFKDKVFRLAKRLLVSTEEAEDATQEVLVKLWNKNENLNNYNSVEAFAMTMTKNYCLDQLKSKRATNLKIVHTNFSDREPSLDQQVEDVDSLSWVEKIINQLPEQQRLIIQMRDVEQYEFEEMAKILEMNETAIRVALSRARKTIRENMTKIHHYGTH
jgi:RNA polymerase sigma factor (sigma-70 family)